ncbi:nicotinate-nucleotide--dimethylbenzimidazole phosphoribosyltransferase, partial [Patescibacteria group bacterium]
WNDAAHVVEVAARPDRRAATAVRDRADTQVRPAGSLGVLESLSERWAAITGDAPPPRLRAGVLICAADHGHTMRGSSLYGADVSTDIAAAAARGDAASAVLAADGGHTLVVADVGLAGRTPSGVVARKVAEGTNDVLAGPAMSEMACAAAMRAGDELAAALIDEGVDCLVLGEIGIGNTTTAAMLLAALTGAAPERVIGRGVGVDTAGLARKRDLVAAALERHAQAIAAGPQTALATVGGLELAALTGAIGRAWQRRVPVVLDGFAATVPALVATRMDPTAADVLVAGHRSPEPGHGIVLAELGLEPLLDLRMRVGEGAGALMALGVIARAGALHAGLGTFAER